MSRKECTLLALWLLLGTAAAFVPSCGYADEAASAPLPTGPQFQETRYCGTPKRDANGDISRSSTVIRVFRLIHRCPATGLQTGACPGWAIDHVIPLACGGCDAVSNLHWLDELTKAFKDLFERRINALDPPVEGTEKICRFQITK